MTKNIEIWGPCRISFLPVPSVRAVTFTQKALSRFLSSKYGRRLGRMFGIFSTTLKSADVTNPVSIQDRVQSSVKAEELDMRFRKKSGLWFYTSFITQIIAYMHCFSHWTTAIPFLGLLQIDSADLQLCQNFYLMLIFLVPDFPHTFSK